MANANLDSKPFLSIMVSTRNRPKELLHCLQSVQNQTFKNYEVIVLDDGGDSSQQTEAILKQIFPKGIFLCNQTCQGISSSRNSMMGAASGDWYFTIDDDAFFPSKLGLQMVVDRLNTLPNDYRILAVKILDFFKPDQRRFLVPFPKYKLAREPQLLKWAGPVSYYLGGAQAIHRSLIEDIGGYDSSFVYGQEEQDLSYRTLEAGYKIAYAPEIEVHHVPAKSALAGTGKKAEMHYSIRSRFVIATRYLPLWAIPSYLLAWSLKYAVHAFRDGDFKSFVSGIYYGTCALFTTPRQPVSWRTIRYLNRYYGRLWY